MNTAFLARRTPDNHIMDRSFHARFIIFIQNRFFTICMNYNIWCYYMQDWLHIVQLRHQGCNILRGRPEGPFQMPGSGNHFPCNSEGLCGPTPMAPYILYLLSFSLFPADYPECFLIDVFTRADCNDFDMFSFCNSIDYPEFTYPEAP